MCKGNAQKQPKTLHLRERSRMGLVVARREETVMHVVAMSISVLNLRKNRRTFFELLEWLTGFLYPLKKE